MADSTIAIDEPSTVDKLLDTEQLTVGANTVQRERVEIAGSGDVEIARVLAADPVGTEYALLVRTLQGYASSDPLFTDPIDRALRDNGKIDIAGFDVALPAGSNTIGKVDQGAAGAAAWKVDGSGVTQPVSGTVTAGPNTVSSATLSNVSASASSVTVIASNASRKGAVIYNDSTVNLRIKFGSTASATSFTYLIGPGQTWEMPISVLYTGIITGIWDSATGTARVTEL